MHTFIFWTWRISPTAKVSLCIAANIEYMGEAGRSGRGEGREEVGSGGGVCVCVWGGGGAEARVTAELLTC